MDTCAIVVLLLVCLLVGICAAALWALNAQEQHLRSVTRRADRAEELLEAAGAEIHRLTAERDAARQACAEHRAALARLAADVAACPTPQPRGARGRFVKRGGSA